MFLSLGNFFSILPLLSLHLLVSTSLLPLSPLFPSLLPSLSFLLHVFWELVADVAATAASLQNWMMSLPAWRRLTMVPTAARTRKGASPSWTGRSIYMSVYMSVPHYLDFFSFVVSLKSGSVGLSALFFLFQDWFGYSESLAFPYEFWEQLV